MFYSVAKYYLSDYDLNLVCEDVCFSNLVDCAQACNSESTCLTECAREEATCIKGCVCLIKAKDYRPQRLISPLLMKHTLLSMSM